MTTSDGRPLHGLAGPRARRVVGLLLVGVLALLCSGPAVGSGGGVVPPEDPDNPPFLRGFITTVGRSEAVPSKQWFRLPPTSAYVRIGARDDGGTGARVEVFVVSPKGEKHDYGVLPTTVVRTVAFGLSPALVTLELSQVVVRKKFIEPWVLIGEDVFAVGGRNHLEGRVDVRVKSLEIDGHPVQVGSQCRTAYPAFLAVDGGLTYTSAFGGELTGTLDVPRFTGCGRGNDRLLTSVVSGADNPLEVTQTAACLDDSCPPAPDPPPEYDLPDEE